jgi:hypothetical protein
MNSSKNLFRLAAILTALWLAMLACSFSASTANVSSATLARDPDGAEPTTVFGQEDIFYLIVELANAPDDTLTKATWTAVEAEGTDPDFLIDESELEHGSGKLTFNLENDNLWPAGRYKVDLYLNGELERTLEFEVQP